LELYLKQRLKRAVDPGESAGEQMVKAVLTPAPPHALEALLDAPLPRPLEPSTPQRPSQVLVLRLVDRLPVSLHRCRQRRQGIPCGVRPALDRQGRAQVGDDPVRLARPPPVPGPAKPPPPATGPAQRGQSPGGPRPRPPTAPHPAALRPGRPHCARPPGGPCGGAGARLPAPHAAGAPRSPPRPPPADAGDAG